ncbi:hypothetical protein C1646_778425 [Rhizophagus diaphanus]|nr:hypothetical protein C1646_778425 [Rhizophagus diaphanus] [Rhizophagus sp. MUCL 43196]
MFRHWIGKFYSKNSEWNSNEYTISSKTWVEIGEIMERSRSYMPPDIGCPSCNIVKHSAGFKAVDLYGVGGERLPAFLISFHYLLHVIDLIEDFNPCRGFWQFPMERFCEMLIPLVSS